MSLLFQYSSSSSGGLCSVDYMLLVPEPVSLKLAQISPLHFSHSSDWRVHVLSLSQTCVWVGVRLGTNLELSFKLKSVKTSHTSCLKVQTILENSSNVRDLLADMDIEGFLWGNLSEMLCLDFVFYQKNQSELGLRSRKLEVIIVGLMGQPNHSFRILFTWEDSEKHMHIERHQEQCT